MDFTFVYHNNYRNNSGFKIYENENLKKTT